MQNNYSKRTGALSARAFAAFWTVLAAAAGGGASAAPVETVLYSFTGGSDGDSPRAGLIADSSGNLYGATSSGGGGSSQGVVFKLLPGGTETVLHTFCNLPGCSDGSGPEAGLIADSSGNLYGTTFIGGTSLCFGQGCGVVFKLSPGGTETVLHAFTGFPSDGAFPELGLIADSSGNLYGTTLEGGGGSSGCYIAPSSLGCGVVFKLSPGGTETVLHSFTGGSDGLFPTSTLIADSGGNLFGTAVGGGASGNGVVFKLSPSGTETVLYSFKGGSDGGAPEGGMIADSSGNLYGTTGVGGASVCIDGLGCGVVFKLTPGGTETVLHSFAGGSDGSDPVGGLIADSSGNLFGTTGGGGGSGCGGSGCGTVFKLTPGGTETVLYSFTGGSDGGLPRAGLIADSGGNLYGTTLNGGASDAGTVFKLTGTGFVPDVPFAALSGTLSINFGKIPNTDSFILKSSFTLGSASKEINPAVQPVTFQVGNYAVTIPPGSFTGTVTSSAFGPFFFTGTINGVSLHAAIMPTGAKRFSFQAGAQNASLTGTKNPVPLTLTVGNNSGTASVSATLASASATH
ncbi:MAG: choice-of-anchor tandem repeat GloVer-containing protein [Methylocella sp.]